MTMMRFNQGAQLSELFEDLFGNERKEKLERKKYECSPSTNILENEGRFQLQMAIPGVKKEEIKIDLEKNILNISSEKSVEEGKDESTKFTRREFRFGTFSRSFTLPETIDTENIGAEVNDGVLTVSLPKKEEVKVSKQIKVA